MGLRLTVLGCSGSFPAAGQACSGYLVRDDNTAIWVDAGSGTMANLQRHITLEDVTAVILTHDHPDHWSDIDGFQVAAAYAIRRFGVPTFAPAAVQPRTYGFNHPSLDWQTIVDGSKATVGTIDLRFAQTEHEPETLAVRFDSGGSSLVYTADTGPGWSLESLGREVDLALCEATWLEAQAEEIRAEKGKPPTHLTGREAGRLAREAGARRLMLTHFWPGNDREESRAEAEATFGGPVELAQENEEYVL